MVLPATRPALARMARLRRGYPLRRGERLPYSLEYALARLLYMEIQAYSSIEDIR